MVHYLVRRATSNMLMGPDWAMNAGICDMLNHDASQSRDVVRGLKKRLRRKNPKVQLLALTLLETIIKNCGDIVHMHVAEKEVIRDLVKIVRKRKPDFHVREKILILINTWQEDFGGPRGRYPQFYAAYQELLHLGIVFPPRSESSAPVFVPPQNSSSRNKQQEEAETEPEFPTLSLTEIQNARGVMDVLAEMLNALDPAEKQGLRQEAIIDLVEQCRTYKGRVVHLINSTSDESLLSEGLALNDALQRLLAKHEAIASGGSDKTEKPNPEPDQSLIDLDAPLIDTGVGNQTVQGSIQDAAAGNEILLLTSSPSSNGQSSNPATTEHGVDLLSGESFGLATDEHPLALVPVVDPQTGSPVTQQNALAVVDMHLQNIPTQSTYTGKAYPCSQGFQNQSFQSSQVDYSNGTFPSVFPTQYEQSPHIQGSDPAWNGHMAQQQQQLSLEYGAQSDGSFPPPPWEALLPDDSQAANSQAVVIQPPLPFPSGSNLQGSQTPGNEQPLGMYIQPGDHLSSFENQTLQRNHAAGMLSQQNQGGQFVAMHPQAIHPGQMAFIHPQQTYGNQMMYYGYGYGQQQNARYIEQRMAGLALRNNEGMGNSLYQVPSAVHVPSGRPSKPEDRLFGDLVDIAKSNKKNPSI